MCFIKFDFDCPMTFEDVMKVQNMDYDDDDLNFNDASTHKVICV